MNNNSLHNYNTGLLLFVLSHMSSSTFSMVGFVVLGIYFIVKSCCVETKEVNNS